MEQAETVIGKVQERQNDLLTIQQYPCKQADGLFPKAVTESYLAQTGLCVKLSSQLTSSELCTWMVPDLYQSLYQKQQTQQAQAANIDLIQKDACVLIRMPHPLLRYHIKKTGAPFLDALEQALYHVPLPDGFAAQKTNLPFYDWHKVKTLFGL